MTALETWLQQATRHLSRDSAARVRIEILDHYESAREAALSGGVSAEAAEGAALSALGSAKAANCQYRRILLTSLEARMLREGNCEARAVCSRPWIKWLFQALPVYTPSRARIFRAVKWVVLMGVMAVAFGQDAFKSSWLMIACLWPIVWIEWTRVSIRRKLPVSEWPKHLYL